MAIAVQHSKEFPEWSYSFAVLMRHDSLDLVQVGQVMRRPGCQ